MSTVTTMTPLAAMDLITLSPEKFTAEVYAPFKRRLELSIDEVREVKYDITTTAGMKVAVECRATFRRLRLDVEGARKERKAPLLTIGDLIDAGGNAVKAQILPLETLFDDQITEEVERKAAAKLAAEKAAIAQALAVSDAIAELRQCEIEAVRICTTAAETQAAIDALEAREISADVYFERQAEAEIIKAETLAAMRALHGTRSKAEDDAARAAAKRIADDLRLAEETARVAAAMAEVAAQRKANDEAKRAQEIAAAALAQQKAEFAAKIKAHDEQLARDAEAANAAMPATSTPAVAPALAAPAVDPMAKYADSIQSSMGRSMLQGPKQMRPAAVTAALSPPGLLQTPIVVPADADSAPRDSLMDDLACLVGKLLTHGFTPDAIRAEVDGALLAAAP